MRKLTIAIPTFRRPEQIQRRILELIPQLTEETELRVFENGRTDELAAFISPYVSDRLHYLPSIDNHGVYRNILRCIEEGQSEWVWILGDDDAVNPDAVSRILCACENTDSFAVSYRSFTDSDNVVTVVDSVPLLFRETSLSEALFLTSTIWRRKALLEHVDIFLQSAYTMSPQLVVMLRLLDLKSGTAEIRRERLVDPCVTNHRWSRVDYVRCSPIVLDFVSDPECKLAVAQQAWANWLWAVKDSIQNLSTPGELRDWTEAFWRGHRILSPHIRHIHSRFRWKSLLGGFKALVTGGPLRNYPLFVATLPNRIQTGLMRNGRL